MTASFPWDPVASPREVPEHTPAPPIKSGPNAPNNASPTGPPNSAGSGVSAKQEPNIKQENNPMSLPFSNAQERAEHLVQQRRIGTLNNLQNSPISLPGQQGQTGYPNLPYPNQQQLYQQQQRPPQQWPQQQQPQQQQRPQPQPQMSPRIKQEPLGGNDGAGDHFDPQAEWRAVNAGNLRAKEDIGLTRQADRTLTGGVKENMRLRAEAGGLLGPIDERYSVSQRMGKSKRSRGESQECAAVEGSAKQIRAKSLAGRAAAYDGPDDEEDSQDKDAINSDLDDSEGEVDDGTVGEDFDGDTIICLYDKVQRVKNKWKCVLKDGVVNADGKEYVLPPTVISS